MMEPDSNSGARKRVLIISPAFAPMSTPDSQRVRMSLPYFRENGWEPIVLAVDPTRVEAPREDSLLATIPTDVEVHHCSALAPQRARRFGLGNLGWRAFGPILRAGAQLIRDRKIDLVYFSTTQFALLPLGRFWQRQLDVPYVIDLQDPWRTDYYERPGVRRPPGGWKYQLARLQAASLEAWTFRRLSGLISVSEQYVREINARYRWFRAIPAATIRFGASEYDLKIALADPVARPTTKAKTVRFVYTGAAGPITPHAISVFFSALLLFRTGHPAAAKTLRCEFIGTSYGSGLDARPTLLPLAEKFGVADLVYETAARVGHLECLRHQAEADVLLLLGSSDRAYSPSKIYPYYLSGRPILSVVFRGSTLEKLMGELSCAEVAAFDETDSKEAEATILRFLETATKNAGHITAPRNDSYFETHYLARNLTRAQTDLFARAVSFYSGHAPAVI